MTERLSNTEAFMWSLGDDPNLASTMGLVLVLSDTPDRARVRNTVAALLDTVERFRLRVVGLETGGDRVGAGALQWRTDDQFDLDHHLRFSRIDSNRPVAVDGPELRALAARFINDPFDRTRPLWQFHFVTGLAGKRSALLVKVHHSISDGMGLVRLGLNLLDFEADAKPRDPVDVDQLMTGRNGGPDRDKVDGAVDRPTDDESDESRQADGTADGPLDGLHRLWGLGEDVVTSVKATGVSLTGGPQPSPLWSTRSRNRRYEVVVESLDAMKHQAHERQVTVNDLFVTACAQAALHYHEEHGIDLDRVLATVVINLSPPDQDGGGPGGEEENAFLPVPVEIPGAGADVEDRLVAVREAIKAKREMLAGRASAMNTLASLGKIVPPSMAARLMVEQAGRVDFATSNVPGLPLPAWCAGSKAEAMYPVGPVTGTAFNATLLSYSDRSYVGLHLDPVAVTDSELLAKSLGRSFRELGVARL